MLTNVNGTSAGTLGSTDDGVVVPLVDIQSSPGTVSFRAPAVTGRYVATLSGNRTELTGTWSQGPFSAPVRFTRVEQR